ncbi:protein prenylyltransferase [Mycena amicta]|nr:protein prenylyltransferase [Mycena amicta]
MANTDPAMVLSLGDVLLQPGLKTIEIIPGGPQTWATEPTESFLFVDGNLGVFHKVLYAIYPLALSLLHGANASQASAVILLANPAHQTALNVRKRLIQSGLLSAATELAFFELLMPSSRPAAKESIAWAHRRWLFEHLYPSWEIPPQRFASEFSLIAKCCELYPRNYLAWSHHYFFVHRLHTALNAPESPYVSVLLAQARRLQRWIHSHVSDFSAMHHYCQLLSGLQTISQNRAHLRELLEPSLHLQHAIGLLDVFPDRFVQWAERRGS